MLCNTIEERFKNSQAKLSHPGQLKIHNKSIFDFVPATKEPCFVVGMEILDNMPHDRLYKDNEEITDPWIYQAAVQKHQVDGKHVLEEVLEPIKDKW